MQDFNPDLPIFDEVGALAKLGHAPDPLFVRALREMAHKGESLRKRFENSCNYAWASGASYEAASLVIAKAIYGLARDAGLRCYLQTDPRGATHSLCPLQFRTRHVWRRYNFATQRGFLSVEKPLGGRIMHPHREHEKTAALASRRRRAALGLPSAEWTLKHWRQQRRIAYVAKLPPEERKRLLGEPNWNDL